ncbi:type I methionyl aminopeptidase [Anaerotignum propionicum]|jgi:methionyl aminopeptidase|uniref:Methionine aminopeptidase n=1 Tax=Anaerotignum propionicum DSM 1682 TaxID=991789 RepID=A0A110A6W4_ANAPI|nr:type I methionyl aminopeptidase [Anaerotignum propionicum]AMJ40163.1 methionine aminopeptidase 1 [Anaerotignum propionicum DSM 1682]SHF13927.1 methionine aminopeptidase, type I [[Clostridium] propionicum DSM 1682] [Anaerotignum propionicum DSM 1682]
MAITIKTENQIAKMRRAGQLLAKTEELIAKAITPGVTTAYLDQLAENYIRSQGGIPSFKGYGGFPATLCTSVNEEVVHGIPGKRILKEGDILSVDMGCILEGYHGDMARTYAVGEISAEAKKLIEVTKQSFFEGIKFAKEGNHLNDIGSAIQKYVEENGFSVVRAYVGHGIGKELHEAPEIPNFRTLSKGAQLKKGMTLAIEPMVNVGDYNVRLLKDGWTTVTKDGKYAAHYENTILITDGTPEILTLP